MLLHLDKHHLNSNSPQIFCLISPHFTRMEIQPTPPNMSHIHHLTKALPNGMEMSLKNSCYRTTHLYLLLLTVLQLVRDYHHHPGKFSPQMITNQEVLRVMMYIQQSITTPTHLPPLNNQAVYPQQQQLQGQQIIMSGMIPQQQQIQPHMYPQQMAPQQTYTQPYGYGNNYGYGYGYGYGQQQNFQFTNKSMSGFSVRDNTTTVYTGPSMANSSYVHVPSGKPT